MKEKFESNVPKKPVAKILDTGDNEKNFVKIAKTALQQAGQRTKAREMCRRIHQTNPDVLGILSIISEYVEVV